MVAHAINEQSEITTAKLAFEEGAREICGVAVSLYGPGTLDDQSILVVVPDMLGATADLIYALEVRVRKQYKNARLKLDIKPRDVYELEMQEL